MRKKSNQKALDNLFNSLEWKEVKGEEKYNFFIGKQIVKVELVDVPLVSGVSLYLKDENDNTTIYDLDFYDFHEDGFKVSKAAITSDYKDLLL